MKAFLTSTIVACVAAGCASNDSMTASRNPGELFSDQPQTSIAGEGSLMPGAYSSRQLHTGQFTGRERTNDQIGQRPTLPREADSRELARSEDSPGNSGAGTLGQSGVVPDEPVSSETLMETTATPGAPAHVAVAPPASRTEQERIDASAVGSAPSNESGTDTSTNAPNISAAPEE